ncbi:MAG: WG repeat-containing protein [Tannerella sp.]|nr:WG repeat-containing protein [Tannerella sp.]
MKKVDLKKILVGLAAASILCAMIIACGQKYQGNLVPVHDETIGKWGYADTTGKNVILPKWDKVGEFSEELAVVCTGGKYGFINRKGLEIIKPQYDAAAPFADGQAEVEIDGKIGKIDAKGNAAAPFKNKEVFQGTDTFKVRLLKKGETINKDVVTGEFIVGKRAEENWVSAESPAETASFLMEMYLSNQDYMALCSKTLNKNKVDNALAIWRKCGGGYIIGTDESGQQIAFFGTSGSALDIIGEGKMKIKTLQEKTLITATNSYSNSKYVITDIEYTIPIKNTDYYDQKNLGGGRTMSISFTLSVQGKEKSINQCTIRMETRIQNANGSVRTTSSTSHGYDIAVGGGKFTAKVSDYNVSGTITKDRISGTIRGGGGSYSYSAKEGNIPSSGDVGNATPYRSIEQSNIVSSSISSIAADAFSGRK